MLLPECGLYFCSWSRVESDCGSSILSAAASAGTLDGASATMLQAPLQALLTLGHGAARREQTMRYGIEEQLRRPPTEFADVIKAHFR